MLLQLEMFIELQVQLNIFRGISLEIPVIRLAKDHVLTSTDCIFFLFLPNIKFYNT